MKRIVYVSYTAIIVLIFAISFSISCDRDAGEDEEPPSDAQIKEKACQAYCDTFVICSDSLTKEGCIDNCAQWYFDTAYNQCQVECAGNDDDCDKFWDCLNECNAGGGTPNTPF